jgi:hypothetical protein
MACAGRTFDMRAHLLPCLLKASNLLLGLLQVRFEGLLEGG